MEWHLPTIGEARNAISSALGRAEFYRMWQTGAHAGLTHGKILDAMGERSAADAEQLRMKLLEGTRKGRTIADIIAENRQLVQPFEGALLSFGEESGTLETSLKTLGAHFEMEHRLLNKVWTQLTYPLLTLFAAIFIAPLPVLVFGNVTAYAFTVAIGLFAWYSFGGSVVTALAAQYANRREFVLGRLARGLANAIEAGLPLDRAVALAAEATGHSAILAHVRRQGRRALATQPASQTFSGCSAIPAEMIAAMKVAEVSGDFSNSLRKMAELYDGVQ